MSAPSSRVIRDVKQLKPRGRWWLRVFRALVALLLVALVGHWQWGLYEGRRLERHLAGLRAAGEWIYPEDFVEPSPPADAENATVELLAAAKIVSEATGHRGEWRDLWTEEVELPLSCGGNYVLDELMAEDWVREALASVEAAARKPRIRWKWEYEAGSGLAYKHSPWGYGDDLAQLLVW